SFIAAPLRNRVARRFVDAAAMTALSQANAANIAPWLRQPATVVYSGVPADMIDVAAEGRDGSSFTLTLIGAIYEPARLHDLAAGVAAFLGTEPDVSIRLVYVGTDKAAVEAIGPQLGSRATLEIRGQ